MPSAGHRSLLRSARLFARRNSRVLIVLLVASLIELYAHIRSFDVPRPPVALDAPFYEGCQDPVRDVRGPRANATIVMLARNVDREGAVAAIQSLEEQFNHRFGYPIVFLNDEPFDAAFKNALSAVASGESIFEAIPQHMWGFPPLMDHKKAQKRMRAQQQAGIIYAGMESYHHMCRFNSGMFYDHPALQKYKWYWRVEPDVRFLCDVTYDPFLEMERHGKRYGWTIALWEDGRTAPSLYRKVADYKARHKIPSSSLWQTLRAPSWMPWPLRGLIMSHIRNRDADGDLWNMCHFWSNFEIADMDFFRSDQYRDFFQFLDHDGGFYHERWGDAPVHSLAAALFLRPEEVHHFSDFGYAHPPFQYCSAVLPDGEVPDLDGMRVDLWNQSPRRQVGCRCTCEPNNRVIRPPCINRIRKTVQ